MQQWHSDLDTDINVQSLFTAIMKQSLEKALSAQRDKLKASQSGPKV